MKTVALVLAVLAIGCVTGEDHQGADVNLRGDTAMQVTPDAGFFDAGPPCPTNTFQVTPCNGDPYWSTCRTLIYPNPPACDSIDHTTEAWRNCVSPPAFGCTMQIGDGPPSACVASCQ